MIEKIKYHLSNAMSKRQMRIKALAVMTAITIAVVTLLNCSINTVKIFDGEKTYTVRTLNNNTLSALSTLRLKSDKYSIIKTSVLNNCTSVEIAYTFPVYVTQGDETKEIKFVKGNVGDALKLAGITPDEYDFVEPSLDTEIKDTIYIDYTDINYVNGNYNEEIPFLTDTVYTDTKNNGIKEVKNGTNGVQTVSYTDKLVNGVSVEKTINNVTVISNPINSVITIGTKITPRAVATSSSASCISTLSPTSEIALDEHGNPVNYKSKMISRATAYTYTGHNCATGVAPQPGYIAVNPNVIPYGTKMYIKTADGNVIYGYAVAADTGGFTKWSPNGVDLFMSSKSACTKFGVRNVEIYILE